MMKAMKLRSCWGGLAGAALLAGLVLLGSEAQARGGGGGISGGSVGGGSMGGGGISGGSFRSGGGWGVGPSGIGVVVGPRGGEVVQSPAGGTAVKGPRGGGVARGPQGGEAATGISGQTAVRGPGYSGGAHMVTPSGNWGPYYGPARNPAATAATAAAAALGTGMLVSGLPPGTLARTVAGKKYFFDGLTYYLPCYQGSELAYCVVPDPNK
jgi:hypothetical protein